MRYAVYFAAVLGACGALCASSAYGQGNPALVPLPKECEAPGSSSAIATSPLPNIANALRERKRIKILAIGGTSASSRGPVSGGHYAVVERFLESAFKGLNVEIVHRGVSGELAANAAQRVRTEVALTGADLVLWQLGTADAFAQMPVDEVYRFVSETITWLRENKTDVILVGMRYARSMARDSHYQAMRAAIQKLAQEHNVLRIGRYEAEEMLEKIRRQQGVEISEAEVTESGYVCMAEYLARVIAAGLFARGSTP